MKSFFVVLIILSWIANVFSIHGEIISCSRCRLNGLPEVRRFLKEPGHADAYENLKVTFIFGRNPDLFIKDDDGKVIETIDLSPYTTEAIHNLLKEKGFERKPSNSSRSSSSANQSLSEKQVVAAAAPSAPEGGAVVTGSGPSGQGRGSASASTSSGQGRAVGGAGSASRAIAGPVTSSPPALRGSINSNRVQRNRDRTAAVA